MFRGARKDSRDLGLSGNFSKMFTQLITTMRIISVIKNSINLHSTCSNV